MTIYMLYGASNNTPTMYLMAKVESLMHKKVFCKNFDLKTEFSTR